MGVVGAVVDAAIGWLLQNILESLFTRQMEAWSHAVGLAEDVDKLKSEMRKVQMVLAAAGGRRFENKPLSQALDDLKELLYDAEDVMDELDYYRLQQRVEQDTSSLRSQQPWEDCSNPERSTVSSSTPASLQLAYSAASQVLSMCSLDRKRKREEEPAHSTILPIEKKHDISERIMGIVNGLGELCNSVQGVLQLEISRPISLANKSQSVSRNTTSIPIEDKVYGRDAERDKVIELLVSGKSSDLHVLPIVGIGGVGKTTLARFVYGDQRIKDHFNLRMWVCVSTNFDEVRLTREILEHVCTDRQQYENITNFNIMQDNLLKSIENKRFLLVLDDMWEEKDKSGWVSLLAPLRCNHIPGCMILVTTRKPSVSKMIGTMDPVQVNGLDEKEFWLFFKACAFGNENHEGHPSLQSIGQQIVKALKGCPLAARSVGALLSRNVSYEHWMTVQNKWKSLQEDTDGILPILKISYDFLPVHLQQCFSYCSLFPEDYRFYGEILVRTWMSQSFVQFEETGREYLDNLVDLGFFQKIDSHYVMHDLMHELAQEVSLNECATITGSQSEAIQPSARHLSIITTAYGRCEQCNFPVDKFEKTLQNIGSPEKLRTLMVFGQSSEPLLSSLLTLCKKSKSLRVLRIYGTHDNISSTLNLLNPYHLRFLEFSDVFLATFDSKNNISLPRALTKFYHLQFLYTSTRDNISVPAGMNNLVNLQHLITHKEVHSQIAGVGKLTSLQGLEFKVRNDGDFKIEQLQPMRKLVTLRISQLQNVKTKEEACGARLIHKEYLEELSLSWNDVSMAIESCTNVLEGLQPSENLKSLHITGYCGAAPTWFASNVSVTNLQILHLEDCRVWQILPSPEMLPFLRKLKLIRMWNLMEISIPSLEELVLIEMPRLVKCVGAYGMELTSRLIVLIIKGCPQLNEFTPFLSYSFFQAEQQSWFPFLRELTIRCCPHIIKWDILPLGGMRALKELKLTDLHHVRELSFHSLEKLALVKMPSLERCIGLTGAAFSPSEEETNVCLSSLRSLTIHDCPSLMMPHPLPPSADILYFSIKGKSSIDMSCASLEIESSELSVLDDQIFAFHNLRGLTQLKIENCPKLNSISCEGFSQLTGLQSLSIYNCPNLLKPPIMLEAASEKSTSGNNVILPCLKSLSISACGIAGGWLNRMLRHLLSLEFLRFDDCPQIKWLSISQPTEAEGSSSSLASAVLLSAEEHILLNVPSNILCSLKQLTISRCEDLEFYGDMRGFGGFTTLEKLEINYCPKLAPPLVSGSEDDDTSSVDVGLIPPSLKQLSILGCPKLVSLLVRDTKDDTSNADVRLLPPSLEVLCLHDVPENLLSYSPKGLAHLKRLSLENSSCFKCVQLHSCTALEELQVGGCQQLGALEGLQSLRYLRNMAIEMNPDLSAAWDWDPKLQMHEHGENQIGLLPLSIKKLDIKNLTDNVQSCLLSCLPAITKLVIQASPELTSLQLGNCTALTELEIRCCKSLTSIEGFQSIRNLTSITVAASSLPPWMERLSQQQGVCEVFSRLERLQIGDASVLIMSLCKQFTSLKVLQFCGEGTSSMVSLTEEQERALQLLTFLQFLGFADYPNLISLPANLRSLVTLYELTIISCPRISGLPEMATSCILRVCDCSEELSTLCEEWEQRRMAMWM
ncbi:hypothetical protein BS78_05G032700 [Paspalum vaginatum]|nr:hypothetical protein BS78_05G032700 [Paspalum vaginatum]KAJ1274042.1 hypothetical protein BS78_05G032700 [Paspalum vaginatum]